MKKLFLLFFFICVAVQSKAAITINEVHLNVSCYGSCDGLISVSASGGVVPYTFTGLPGGPVCPGIYPITVTDAVGQTASISITITEPPLLVANASSTDVTCNGACDGATGLTVTGGTSPYSYAWCNGSTVGSGFGFCAGSCTVTVTDNNGCQAIDTVVITEPPAIGVSKSITQASCSGCCDGDIQLTITGGTPGYTIIYSPGPSPLPNNYCSGIYNYCITDANGCSYCDSATVSFPLEITNPELGNNYNISPNPAIDFIDIENEGMNDLKNCSVSIFDNMGKLILKGKLVQNKTRVNLSSFSYGIYFIQLQSDDKMLSKKFIKQ